MKATKERPPRVLLIAEAVTLAHFARIISLAKSIERMPWQVVVAADSRYFDLNHGFTGALLPIQSISGSAFAESLERGRPVYDFRTLEDYVRDDLELLGRVAPDLIIGDFRLSLCVSAPMAGIPYGAVVNAYWSPYADIAYPVPDVPMTRLIGVRAAQRIFDALRPMLFAKHARPIERLRRAHGLPPVGNDVRSVYTWGDHVLYADAPGLVPMRPLPPHHRFLGPVRWSADVAAPVWWDALPNDRPLVLVTLGTSGRADILPTVVAALAPLPLTVVIATAGRIPLQSLPSAVFAAEYLPLSVAVRRASLVVCNGGSLTTYEACEAGKAVLGICSNMDQLLNMQAIERLGAGLSIRAATATAEEVRNAVRRLLESPNFAASARTAGDDFRRIDAGESFRSFVAGVLPGERSARTETNVAEPLAVSRIRPN